MEETRRKKSSSGEIFSFPSTPTQDSEPDFEFGCLTPDSPSQDPQKSSPADHLFYNGRLLPHSFPVQPPLISDRNTTSRGGTSRTSSVSSCKDSLVSSRSNSTNSRSSSCSTFSSARTSLSSPGESGNNYGSERKILDYYYNRASYKVSCKSTLYGSSQRWQYVTAVPALKREVSRRRSGGGVTGKGGGGQKRSASQRKGFWKRFFMSFLVACRQCHAMEVIDRDDDDGVL